jgi:hypothetical protein
VKGAENLVFIVPSDPQFGIVQFNGCGIKCPDAGDGNNIGLMDPDELLRR